VTPDDIDVFTSVRAKRLRFEKVPETRVWFEGEPAESSSSETERVNLPEEVEPGVEYRDVEVRWRARSSIVHPTDADAPPHDAEPTDRRSQRPDQES
jgi:hypothetical protein